MFFVSSSPQARNNGVKNSRASWHLPSLWHKKDIMDVSVFVLQVAADAYSVVPLALGRLAVAVYVDRLVVLEMFAVRGLDGQVRVAGQLAPVVS
jgi:hypothetical protein